MAPSLPTTQSAAVPDATRAHTPSGHLLPGHDEPEDYARFNAALEACAANTRAVLDGPQACPDPHWGVRPGAETCGGARSDGRRLEADLVVMRRAYDEAYGVTLRTERRGDTLLVTSESCASVPELILAGLGDRLRWVCACGVVVHLECQSPDGETHARAELQDTQVREGLRCLHTALSSLLIPR